MRTLKGAVIVITLEIMAWILWKPGHQTQHQMGIHTRRSTNTPRLQTPLLDNTQRCTHRRAMDMTTHTCARCNRVILVANAGITTCICGVRHHAAPTNTEAQLAATIREQADQRLGDTTPAWISRLAHGYNT